MTAAGLKLMGAAVIFLSAAILHRTFCGRQKAVTAQIGGFLCLFRAIRRGIADHRAPLGDIFSRLDSGTLAACQGGDGVRIRDLSELNERCSFLSDGLSRLMTEACGELGRGYHEEQLAACDRYLSALESLHRESEKKEKETSQLIGTLIFTAAAALVVLLI